MNNLTELNVNRTYRAKKPRPVFDFNGGLVNDRTVLYIGLDTVQYDGPAIKNGSKYPTVSKKIFLAWADRDVTDELPPGDYAKWPLPKGGTK
ncbi:hypothetical protein J7S78_13335 [Klebsiella oxytoca]|uniref:Uncharacterized protein n=1 Tax=Klebsiella oxytoca TaxID=571 RepID=A0AAP2BI66_KLEOX|nr:hypothetical protein [Klebsiella oxytoca]MBQ0600774.1 hypothetical protein [Klebsiella oxytoca]